MDRRPAIHESRHKIHAPGRIVVGHRCPILYPRAQGPTQRHWPRDLRLVKSAPPNLRPEQLAPRNDGRWMSKIAKPKPADEVPDVLAEYKAQAVALEAALASVKAMQSEIAETSKVRESALGARQTLIDKWVQADDEAAVEELSRLSSRGDVLQARLDSHATRLAHAEAELKAALTAFAISFNSLFLMLRVFLINDAKSRIASMIHPSVRQISDASISEVAALAIEVVDFEPLAVRRDPMSSMHNNQLPPDAIQRDAERAVPKADALLAEAGRQLENGFVPPPAFNWRTWRESLSPAVAVAA
jgi:hypothetical protein